VVVEWAARCGVGGVGTGGRGVMCVLTSLAAQRTCSEAPMKLCRPALAVTRTPCLLAHLTAAATCAVLSANSRAAGWGRKRGLNTLSQCAACSMGVSTHW
jgi:hypothetical protein